MSDPVRLHHVKYPKIEMAEDGSFKAHQKLVTHCVENMEDFIFDVIVKVLPEDVTQLLVIDKNQIVRALEKEIPLTPKHIEYIDTYGRPFSAYYCAACGQGVYNLNNYCRNCGRKVGERDE